MATKTTETGNTGGDNAKPDDQLTHDQIIALSNNMFEKMLIMDNGNFRKLDPAKDTKSAYIDKSALDALFAAHPGSDGLKIYFGVHSAAVYKPKQPGYENKLTAMLVTTTAGVDNLDKPADTKKVKMALGGGNGGGTGLGGSKLCPPDTNC